MYIKVFNKLTKIISFVGGTNGEVTRSVVFSFVFLRKICRELFLYQPVIQKGVEGKIDRYLDLIFCLDGIHNVIEIPAITHNLSC